MPRASRLIAKGEQAVYHAMSRTALDGYPFGDAEKDMPVRIMKRFSFLYFTEVLGFCVTGNHFHLLVRVPPDSDHSDADIIERMQAFYGKEISVGKSRLPLLREKLSSQPEYVKEIRPGFSRCFDKRHNRKGFLWKDRFKSVMVENAETLFLISCPQNECVVYSLNLPEFNTQRRFRLALREVCADVQQGGFLL